MALRTTSAFVAGMATGWVMRSALGTSREVLVRLVVAAHAGRELLRRNVGEQVEWIEDLFAEGRARYHEARAQVDDHAPPDVRESGPGQSRGRAA